MLDLAIEPIREADHAAIERLHQRAFGPGRFSRTAYRVREAAGEAAQIGFVARVGTYLVGSVQLTPIRIGDVSGLMLGPLTVEPAFEGRGIGTRLLAASAVAARERGCRMILLVGDLAYYARFGYVRAPQGQMCLPGPVDGARLLLLEIEPGILARVRGDVIGLRTG